MTNERMQRALSRVEARLRADDSHAFYSDLRRLLNAASQNGENGSNGHMDRLLVPCGGTIRLVKTDEIDWIEADNYRVRVHVGRKSYRFRTTLNKLEERLDPRRFLRIHRSAIVNLDRVKELRSRTVGGVYTVVLEDGTRLRLSRSRRGKLGKAGQMV